MNNHDQIIERPNVERLNKFIANCGFASRRKVDELISSGRVSVNAKAITELGTRIDPDKDEVKVDGELIKPSQTQCTYILLFKPEGYNHYVG